MTASQDTLATPQHPGFLLSRSLTTEACLTARVNSSTLSGCQTLYMGIMLFLPYGTRIDHNLVAFSSPDQHCALTTGMFGLVGRDFSGSWAFNIWICGQQKTQYALSVGLSCFLGRNNAHCHVTPVPYPRSSSNLEELWLGGLLLQPNSVSVRVQGCRHEHYMRGHPR